MSTKPTVPIVYHFFPHYRGAVNRELLQSRKYRFLFVGASPQAVRGGGIEPWEHPPGTPFIATRNRHPFGRALFQSEVVALAFRRDIESMVFLGCAEFATTWFAAIIARLTGKRVYFWTHGWTEPDQGLKRLMRSAFYRLANTLLLYGHEAKKIGREMGIRNEHMHVIFNSLDYKAQLGASKSVTTDELKELRKNLFGERATRPLLICTGRLIPMRRLELLLDAMTYLEGANYSVNLLLIGDGPLLPELKRHAERAHLAVCFYGSCYDETRLARCFMAADLLVMPGRIGLSAMHSLAYGTPVIVHDNPFDQGPEWESVIPGYNGARFAHENSRDLARVIKEWIEKPLDRQVMASRCKEVLDRFYNPVVQAALIERALDGDDPDDSEWIDFSRAHTQEHGA